MLKGYFDRVWLPGVAFDVTSDGGVRAERLKQLRRIMVVPTYGGSCWTVRFAMGDPARKVIGWAVRALCAQLPSHLVCALQHGQGDASAVVALSAAHTSRYAGPCLSVAARGPSGSRLLTG